MLLTFQSSFLESTMCLCSKPGKAILQLSGSQKAKDFLHMLKLFIPFDHSIPEIKVIKPTVYPLFLAMLRIEHRESTVHAWQMPYHLKPYKTIHQITQEQQINTQDQCALYPISLTPQNP